MRREAVIREVLGDELLDSAWMQRLEGVSFLGSLDDHPRSLRSTSRRAHSLGVAVLGLRVASELHLPARDRRLLVTACLLHDIGHFPLSHSAESGFHAATHATHHDLGRWIVLGEGPIDRSRSLRPLIERLDLDAEQLWALISGDPSHVLAPLLTGRINLDTLEGIGRTLASFGRKAPLLPGGGPAFLLDGGELVLNVSAVPLADSFWRRKDAAYTQIINLPSNVVYEAMLSHAVAAEARNGVFARFETYDDNVLRGELGLKPPEPKLFRWMDRRLRFSNVPTKVTITSRQRKRYWVVGRPSRHHLSMREVQERYRTARELVFLETSGSTRQLNLPGAHFPTLEPEL